MSTSTSRPSLENVEDSGSVKSYVNKSSCTVRKVAIPFFLETSTKVWSYRLHEDSNIDQIVGSMDGRL